MIGRELDGFWKTVVNAIRDGIMIVNTGGAIVSVNRAFEQISGYSREELIGQTEKILNCEFPQPQSLQLNLPGLGRSSPAVTKAAQHKCLIRQKNGSYIHALEKLGDPERFRRTTLSAPLSPSPTLPR